MASHPIGEQCGMDGFDVSVIVAIYESEDLTHVLNSLDRQDFAGRFEVVVCDDGSHTDVRPLLQPFVEANRFDLRYVWHPRTGRRTAKSRNNGIRLARGRLLVFLDGDCLAPTTFLTRHVATHDRDRILVCGSRDLAFIKPGELQQITESESCSPVEYLKMKKSLSMRSFQQRYFPSSQPWMGCIGSNMSVQRTDCVYFDENFIGWGCEENELACRLHTKDNFDIVPDLDSLVYSIEGPPETMRHYSFLRPRSHAEIVDYLRNVQRMRSLYSFRKIMALLYTLTSFEVNPETSEWRRLPIAEAVKRDPLEAIADVDEWWFANRKTDLTCLPGSVQEV